MYIIVSSNNFNSNGLFAGIVILPPFENIANTGEPITLTPTTTTPVINVNGLKITVTLSFVHGKYDFTYVGGHKLSIKKQLRNFAKALKRYAKLPTLPKFDDWSEAFDALISHIESLPVERKKVIFIDEMPWIDTPHSDFVFYKQN